MRYLLNSAVITSPGIYEYQIMSVEEAREWIADGPFTSTIGYQETAVALSSLLERNIVQNRTTITMKPGDEALVFRLAFPPGTPRINPNDKGAVLNAIDAKWYELGLLTRLK